MSGARITEQAAVSNAAYIWSWGCIGIMIDCFIERLADIDFGF